MWTCLFPSESTVKDCEGSSIHLLQGMTSLLFLLLDALRWVYIAWGSSWFFSSAVRTWLCSTAVLGSRVQVPPPTNSCCFRLWCITKLLLDTVTALVCVECFEWQPKLCSIRRALLSDMADSDNMSFISSDTNKQTHTRTPMAQWHFWFSAWLCDYIWFPALNVFSNSIGTTKSNTPNPRTGGSCRSHIEVQRTGKAAVRQIVRVVWMRLWHRLWSNMPASTHTLHKVLCRRSSDATTPTLPGCCGSSNCLHYTHIFTSLPHSPFLFVLVYI